MRKKSNIFLVLSVILLMASNIFSIIVSVYHPKTEKYLEAISTDETSKCFEVYDIETASICLRDWMKGFYNYTIREDTIKSIDDIKINGGDCFDYTMIYKSYLSSNDYITQEVSIYPIEKGKAGHTFLIAWDKNFNKYCRIDQLFVNCLTLGGNEQK